LELLAVLVQVHQQAFITAKILAQLSQMHLAEAILVLNLMVVAALVAVCKVVAAH